MKSSRRRTSMVPGGGPLFQRMFTRLGCDGRPPRFRVEFYPYSSLVLTIRRREEVVYVRFSDLLQRAPRAVLEGAAALLLARVFRRKASRDLTEPYLEYARSNRTRSRHESHAPRTGSPGRHQSSRGTLRSGRTFRPAQRKILRGPATAPAHWLEHAKLAPAIRVLRSRAKSNPAESPDGPPRRSRMRRGIRFVSRNASRQASDAPLGLQHGLAFAGISRRREALYRIRARQKNSRPPRTLSPSGVL